jgi:hypothetical protein
MLTIIMAMALSAPDVAARGRATPPVPQRHGKTVPAKGRIPKPKPHPHCEGELPAGQVASKDGPAWGAFCRVVYS